MNFLTPTTIAGKKNGGTWWKEEESGGYLTLCLPTSSFSLLAPSATCTFIPGSPQSLPLPYCPQSSQSPLPPPPLPQFPPRFQLIHQVEEGVSMCCVPGRNPSQSRAVPDRKGVNRCGNRSCRGEDGGEVVGTRFVSLKTSFYWCGLTEEHSSGSKSPLGEACR